MVVNEGDEGGDGVDMVTMVMVGDGIKFSYFIRPMEVKEVTIKLLSFAHE